MRRPFLPFSSGAEAILSLNPQGYVEKYRPKKTYRITEIDEPLRMQRTKREAKIMSKLTQNGILVPKIIRSNADTIIMEHIDGPQLKVILDARPQLASLVGKTLATMHDANIIHGDLTTSNMILADKEKLYFIDFGLSFISTRVEDKAVDVHLFRQALESKHFRVMEKAYARFLTAYNPKNRKEILARLEIVEQRGRYKEKI